MIRLEVNSLVRAEPPGSQWLADATIPCKQRTGKQNSQSAAEPDQYPSAKAPRPSERGHPRRGAERPNEGSAQSRGALVRILKEMLTRAQLRAPIDWLIVPILAPCDRFPCVTLPHRIAKRRRCNRFRCQGVQATLAHSRKSAPAGLAESIGRRLRSLSRSFRLRCSRRCT